jgi:DeoR family transcriptional regulator, aga operon transcriptional repressor
LAHIPRHDEILKILGRLRTVTVGELTGRLGVSEVTIRKDLTMLEEMGRLVRTHGGAMLAEDRAQVTTIARRRFENDDAKRIIARRARELCNEDDTIYIDSGSTCMAFAALLAAMSLRIVTNSMDVMTALADAPGISLHSVGGSYRKEAGSFIGPAAVQTLRGFRLEACFLGTTGFTVRGVFSSQNAIEAELKALALSVSRRRIILADRSKYNREAFAVFAGPRDVDVLITDGAFEGMGEMKAAGVEVILADEGSET